MLASNREKEKVELQLLALVAGGCDVSIYIVHPELLIISFYGIDENPSAVEYTRHLKSLGRRILGI